MTQAMRAGACVAVLVLAAGCRERSEPVAAAHAPPPQPTAAVKPVEPCPVAVTPVAAEKVKWHIADVQADPELAGKPLYLRMRVVGGGCSGFQNKLDLDPAYDEELDHLYDVDGIKVVIDKRSLLYLDGATVDYGEEKGKTGFKVENPNFKGDAAESKAALTGEQKAE